MTRKYVRKDFREYWYRFYYRECVMGDSWHEYRERVYDEPKPDNPSKRHIFEQYYCNNHYL